MRILIASDTYIYQTSGAANVVSTLTEGLRKLGHEVRVLTPSDRWETRRIGADCFIRSLPAFYYPDLRVCPIRRDPLLDERKQWKPDLIHLHTEGSIARLAGGIAAAAGAPLVMTTHTDYAFFVFGRFHDSPVRLIMRIYGKLIYRRAAAVVVPSEKARGFEMVKAAGERLRVIPNGIKPERFQKPVSPEEKSALLRQYGLDDNGCTLIIVTRLSREKNIDETVYTEHIQETLKDIMEHPGIFSIISDFVGMASNPELITEENRGYASEMMDFILSVIWDIYFHSGTIQSAWSDDATMFHNLFREHTPSVYLSWMFSSDDPSEIFSDSYRFERDVVEGDVTMSVFSIDGWVQTLYADGVLEKSWFEDERRGTEDIPEIFITRMNNQSLCVLPMDAELLVMQYSDGEEPVEIYCVNYDVLTPENKTGFRMTLYGEAAKSWFVNLVQNSDEPWALSEEDKEEMRSETGLTEEDIRDIEEEMRAYYVNIDYSDITDQLNSDVSLMDRIERMNVFHLSWYTILQIAIAIPVIILLLILFLVFYAVMRRRKKRRLAAAGVLEVKTDEQPD